MNCIESNKLFFKINLLVDTEPACRYRSFTLKTKSHQHGLLLFADLKGDISIYRISGIILKPTPHIPLYRLSLVPPITIIVSSTDARCPLCVDGFTWVTVMASSSDVVKKIMRLKLQLSDKAEPATVVIIWFKPFKTFYNPKKLESFEVLFHRCFITGWTNPTCFSHGFVQSLAHNTCCHIGRYLKKNDCVSLMKIMKLN